MRNEGQEAREGDRQEDHSVSIIREYTSFANSFWGNTHEVKFRVKIKA